MSNLINRADRRETVPFHGRNLHFVGIGGCGMSGLALMLRNRGAHVTGSDQSAGEMVLRLDDAGIDVRVGPAMQSLPEGTDLVIASAAIKPDHPEILAAQAKGIEWVTYAEALGLAQRGMTGVSIAGTHGKSTTTAMTSWVGIDCGLDPSVIVGATSQELGGFTVGDGARIGSNAVVLRAVPPGATAVGNPARVILAELDAAREVAAAKMGFSAYGITQGDDPVAQAMKGLIDNASGQEHQIALLWQAIEKLSAGSRELPAETCVPQDAHTTESFDAERLSRLVK